MAASAMPAATGCCPPVRAAKTKDRRELPLLHVSQGNRRRLSHQGRGPEGGLSLARRRIPVCEIRVFARRDEITDGLPQLSEKLVAR